MNKKLSNYMSGIVMFLCIVMGDVAVCASQQEQSGMPKKAGVLKMNPQLTDDMLDVIKRYFTSNEVEWWVRDLSASYPFLDGKRLVWVIDGDTNRSLLLLQQSKEKWLKLNEEKSSLPVLGDLLRVMHDEISSKKDNIEHFSKLIMELYEEPRGYVCSPDFLEKQSAVLNSFILKDSLGVDELKKSCMTPDYLTGKGNWHLVFNVINVRGSIQKWHVSGNLNPFSIEDIKRTIIHPNDTFYYPDEF
ncbi:MAG: hypothetical protein OEZ39_14675 [Gammaproteobacteria bacterium]|nr:hypothetical protein [Gammaproteobacteria bacterium]MDH5653098.1 hypothetical protein [Gammaproteobacteria bacterium]